MPGVRGRDAITRFWMLVRKTDDCWVWTGALTHDGYGRFRIRKSDGKHGHAIAHRWLYEFIHGTLPPQIQVQHTCDNPSCVRIDHLKIGVAKDNSADMMARNRHARIAARGEAHGKARLTEDDVRWIRQSTWGMSDLARLFGVSNGAIEGILRGDNWKHVK